MKIRLLHPLDFGERTAPINSQLQLLGEHGTDCWRALLDGVVVLVPRWAGVLVEEPLPPEQLAQRRFLEVQAAVQERLDRFARTRAYDGILSACTYAASAVASFAAEGAYAVQARDEHWAKCYEILGAVQAALRPLPTVEEALAEMPPLEWPA